MTRVLLISRLADPQASVDRIRDQLARRLGAENCALLADAAVTDAAAREALYSAVDTADVLLVLIGPGWLTADVEGERSIDRPDDGPRLALERALGEPQLILTPVLIHGARLPLPDALPASLRNLSYRTPAVIRNDPEFRLDVSRFIDRIEGYSRRTVPTAFYDPLVGPPPEPPPQTVASNVGRNEAILLVALSLAVVLACSAVLACAALTGRF